MKGYGWFKNLMGFQNLWIGMDRTRGEGKLCREGIFWLLAFVVNQELGTKLKAKS
jgi:hypothetical protein